MATLQQVIDKGLRLDYGDVYTSPLRLDTQLVTEIQSILAATDFYKRPVDGLFGRFTRDALRDFKEARSISGGDVLGPTTASLLLHSRDQRVGSANPTNRAEAQAAIIAECKRLGITSRPQIAYILATAEHETANTFLPVREAFWLSENWRRNNLPYYPYYGRGYVQLTHDFNYKKYSNLLGMDLLSNPDRVMEPKIALFILVDGMLHGRFTGRKLGEYVNPNLTNFYDSRRVVNGLDRAEHIKSIANGWLAYLNQLATV